MDYKPLLESLQQVMVESRRSQLGAKVEGKYDSLTQQISDILGGHSLADVAISLATLLQVCIHQCQEEHSKHAPDAYVIVVDEDKPIAEIIELESGESEETIN